MRYRQQRIDDEGWSEWVQPRHERYLLKCCDCGLVHEMQFRAVADDGSPYAPLQSEIDGALVLFRARRLRAQERRRMSLREQGS